MSRIIDADSHFMEPLDLWTRYIEPRYRDRCVRFERSKETGRYVLWVNGQPLPNSGDLTIEELLGVAVGYGQKETGKGLKSFDPAEAFSRSLEDMPSRVRFLDEEGIESQFIYPTLGLFWEDLVPDPELAAAHARAYNTWMVEMCAGYRQRLYPVGHLTLRYPGDAVRELHCLAKADVKTVFVGALPIDGKSFGHPDYDPVWAAAQDANIAVGIHLVVHAHYLGNEWYKDREPGFMFLSMNTIQDPRMALTTMVYDGVFERFPRLRVATIESASGWIAEWIDRLDYRFSYMGHTCQMKRPASEYFARNIWISADPHERTLPYMIELLGDDKFFIGSDYPHAEGFTEPITRARKALAKLPETSVNKILGENAAQFFGI
ncbi:MAG: amidohydrolase [Deltaproteobacteria bacterium]|nr:amidohydrolase [Deltaproteobacteria bacterium]